MLLIRKRLLWIWRALLGALALLGLSMVVVTVTPAVKLWARALAGPWNDPGGEVLIVLGGDYPEEGMLGRSTYLRAQYAIRAYREGSFRTIVLCGGGRPESVAESMEGFLVSAGVPRSAILLEGDSTSTRENALFAKPLLANLPGRKVLLTSDFHMHRATLVFAKAGIQVQPRPFPDGLKRSNHWGERWYVVQDCVSEAVKLAYYRVRGWV